MFFCVFIKSIFLQCTHSCCVRYTHHHYFSNAFVQNSLEELLFFQWRLQGLSGMARAPLQMGHRNCLIQIKICHLKFLQQVFCAPHNHWLGKAASVLTQRPCLMRFVGSRVYCTNAHYDKTVVVSHSTTVILWLNNNARMPHLQEDVVLLTLPIRKAKSVRCTDFQARVY